MTGPAKFLGSFGRALASAALYADGHPALQRAIDAAWQDLDDLVRSVPQAAFTLLGDTVLFAEMPIRERRAWEWSDRLSAAGIQRIEIDRTVTRDDFEAFLQDVVSRVSGHPVQSASARQMATGGIRCGNVALKNANENDAVEAADAARRLGFSMAEEAETVRWMHEEASASNIVPLVEAETIVRSLSVAMHADRRIVVPLLQLKEFDQYTTTHSLNVAVLGMAIAEYLGLSSQEVRTYGMAGLLHDIGKTRIPKDILVKPGKLTDAERDVMNRHPVDGARLILKSEQSLDLAAVVAYEHHIMIDGTGYPQFRYGRTCHQASRLVHVCDVFDALRTDRPYRQAWPLQKTLAYIEERAGSEFDADIVRGFVAMMNEWDSRIAVLTSEQSSIPTDAAA
jgi:putative nucleotidyltransferase with HDIG domain